MPLTEEQAGMLVSRKRKIEVNGVDAQQTSNMPPTITSRGMKTNATMQRAAQLQAALEACKNDNDSLSKLVSEDVFRFHSATRVFKKDFESLKRDFDRLKEDYDSLQHEHREACEAFARERIQLQDSKTAMKKALLNWTTHSSETEAELRAENKELLDDTLVLIKEKQEFRRRAKKAKGVEAAVKALADMHWIPNMVELGGALMQLRRASRSELEEMESEVEEIESE